MPRPPSARTPPPGVGARPGWPGYARAGDGSRRLRLGNRCTAPPAPAKDPFNRRASGEERRHDVRIELQAGFDADGGRCRLKAQTLTVRSVGCEGVEDVSHGQDADRERDRRPRQSGRISSPIPPLVVIEHPRYARLQEAQTLEHVVPPSWM